MTEPGTVGVPLVPTHPLKFRKPTCHCRGSPRPALEVHPEDPEGPTLRPAEVTFPLAAGHLDTFPDDPKSRQLLCSRALAHRGEAAPGGKGKT